MSRAGLVFRQDYFGDPDGWNALKALLLDVFGVDAGVLDRFGGPDRTSRPSAFFDADGRCVANFTAFAMPLTIEGRDVRAAGLQSGAVRPEYRGRGLFRELILKTLSHCDAEGFEAVVLYTDQPDLYSPHDFVTVPQHRFCGLPPDVPAPRTPARRLDIRNPVDAERMQGLLAARTPVSNRFAVQRQAEMFLLNACLADDVQLDLLEEHGTVVAWRCGEDGVFELLDVVGRDIPTLGRILAGVGIRPSRVVVHFPPDRLAWDGTAEADESGMAFMMRCAPELVPAGPFSLSPMAEF